MKSKRIILTVLFPLVFGGLIYIFFRDNKLIMFDWFDYLGLRQSIESIRAITFQSHSLPGWFIYSLPDALWLFSFTNVMLLIWNDKFSKDSIFWILLASIIGVFSEIGQYFNIIPGTYDSIDLIFIFIALILSFLLTFKISKTYD